MNINKDNYEIVRFSARVTNRTITKSGYRVGTFLIVALADARKDSWRIYRSQDGMECLRTTFETSDDAIRCAEWLLDTYGEFMFIWTEYPNAELFRWTYLTIPNGEKYMNALEELADKRKVTWDDVCRYFN